MDIITIQDNNLKLRVVLDNLEAMRSVILTVGDHEEYAKAYEALKVIDLALIPIISDIQEVIDTVNEELKIKRVQQG